MPGRSHAVPPDQGWVAQQIAGLKDRMRELEASAASTSFGTRTEQEIANAAYIPEVRTGINITPSQDFTITGPAFDWTDAAHDAAYCEVLGSPGGQASAQVCAVATLVVPTASRIGVQLSCRLRRANHLIPELPGAWSDVTPDPWYPPIGEVEMPAGTWTIPIASTWGTAYGLEAGYLYRQLTVLRIKASGTLGSAGSVSLRGLSIAAIAPGKQPPPRIGSIDITIPPV